MLDIKYALSKKEFQLLPTHLQCVDADLVLYGTDYDALIENLIVHKITLMERRTLNLVRDVTYCTFTNTLKDIERIKKCYELILPMLRWDTAFSRVLKDTVQPLFMRKDLQHVLLAYIVEYLYIYIPDVLTSSMRINDCEFMVSDQSEYFPKCKLPLPCDVIVKFIDDKYVEVYIDRVKKVTSRYNYDADNKFVVLSDRYREEYTDELLYNTAQRLL